MSTQFFLLRFLTILTPLARVAGQTGAVIRVRTVQDTSPVVQARRGAASWGRTNRTTRYIKTHLYSTAWYNQSACPRQTSGGLYLKLAPFQSLFHFPFRNVLEGEFTHRQPLFTCTGSGKPADMCASNLELQTWRRTFRCVVCTLTMAFVNTEKVSVTAALQGDHCSQDSHTYPCCCICCGSRLKENLCSLSVTFKIPFFFLHCIKLDCIL